MQTEKSGTSGPDEGSRWDLLVREARVTHAGCADQQVALVLDIDTDVDLLGAAPDSIVLTRTAALTLLLDLADEFELAVWHTAGPHEPSAEAAVRNRVAAIQAKRAQRITFLSALVDDETDLARLIFHSAVPIPPQRSAPVSKAAENNRLG